MDSSLVGVTTPSHTNNVVRVAWRIVAIVTIALPVFFIPALSVSLSVAKTLLLAVGAIASLAALVLYSIQHGTLRVPYNLAALGTILIPASVFLASTFSMSPAYSFWGYGSEIQSFGVILVATIALFVVSRVADTTAKIRTLLLGLVNVGGVMALFHLLRFVVGAERLSFGLLASPVANVLGAWNELGLFFAFIVMTALIFLELGSLSGWRKMTVWTSGALSLIALAILNISLSWWLLSIFALVLLVYVLSLPAQAQGEGVVPRRAIAWKALSVLVVAVFFIFSGQAVVGGIAERLNIGTVEVRPGWAATTEVTRAVLSKDPLTGIGPNNFDIAWALNKPAGINNTIFWNTDFITGIGLIPTFVATTGVLGLLAWIVFFVMFIMLGVRVIFAKSEEVESRVPALGSFLGASFLWVIAFVSVPSTALFVLAFLMTGAFFGYATQVGMFRTKEFSLFAYPRASFVSVLVLIIALIGTISLGYLFVERALAQIYLERGAILVGRNNDIDGAERSVARSASLVATDSAFRAGSQLSLARIQLLINQLDAQGQDEGALDPATARTQFQGYLGAAVQNARQATVLAPQNYQNWLNLGQIFASVVPEPFAIEGAYEEAKAAFTRAIELNPSSPGLQLSLARLEASNNNLQGAEEAAEKAVAMKQNYTEAHFFLSQVAVAQGNLDRAIEKTETTALLSPGNAGLYFQLGVLHYNQGTNEQAVAALAEAIRILPDYANARYFLGLALARLGEREQARLQFEEILKTNPENTDLPIIIKNLETPGRNPLQGLENRNPERAETLPVGERSSR